MVEWWSILLWKGELISYEIGYLAEEISKQSAEGAARLSLLLIVKREGRGELWEKLLSMKEPEPKDLEKLSAHLYCKKWKHLLESTPRMWLDSHSVNRLLVSLISCLFGRSQDEAVESFGYEYALSFKKREPESSRDHHDCPY